jgi:hypothetical protein
MSWNQHNNPSVVSLRATRKRSLTNLFHARPETLAPLNTVELSLPSSNSEAQLAALSSRSSLAADESGSPIIASRDGTPSPLEKLMLVDQNLDTLTGSSSRLDFFNPEEGSLCDKSVVEEPSFSFQAPAICIFNINRTLHEASKAFHSRSTYLSQARKILKSRTSNSSIVVGFQPRRKGITPREENECFQKIWIHQQKRIEAHHRMECKLELILEEEEINQELKSCNSE